MPSTPTSGPDNSLQGVLIPKGFPGLPDGWDYDWETFASADSSLQLFGAWFRRRAVPPAGRPPRALVVLHGLNEHGGRYAHFPHFLQGTVDGVFCPDHRGHGRSEGLRGHVERFDLLTDDARLAIHRAHESARRRWGLQAELHLFAHSFGGLIALRALFLEPELPVRSATISAPLLEIAMKLPVAKRGAAQLLSRVWGSLHMSTDIRPELVSHDPAVVDAYAKDRLNHRKGTPRLYTELLQAMLDTRARRAGIRVPLQILLPEDDQVVAPQATRKFFDSLDHAGKLMKSYPGFYHEAHNETGKEQVFEDVAAWIRKHSSSTS